MNKLIWEIKKGSYRAYQSIMKIALRVIPYPKQKVLTGSGCILEIPAVLKEEKIEKILLVCSKSVRRRGMLDGLIEGLEKENIAYVIFEDIQPNPTIRNVEKGYQAYINHKCQGIVAIGGGSPLDCAKIIGVKVGNPTITYEAMKHISAIKKPMPYFIAVPTTAGTGSESTVASVITNANNHSKYPVVSMFLMPSCAVLDETLTLDLPKDITAYTGMDALTHAIEAYIGRFGTVYTNEEALKAIKMIFENLEEAYLHGENVIIRKNMLIASNHAANAFTRAYTGYVHTVSHALSAIYNVGHGKTNAIILPHMLKYYGKSIESKLAEIAIYTGLGKAEEEQALLAQKVIDKIQRMNENMNIPSKVEELKEKDIQVVVSKALKEGNPSNPVPKIMNYEEMERVVRGLMNEK